MSGNSNSNSFKNPTKHTGQNFSFAPRYERNRDPLPTDIRPPEQGGYYPLGSIWSTKGTEKIWILTLIAANVAYWLLLASSAGPLLNIAVPLGISPIKADSSGLVTFTSTDGSVKITGSTSPNPNFINFKSSFQAATYIVSPTVGDGDFTTIGAAVTAIGINVGTILVKTGNYSGDFTFPTNATLMAFNSNEFGNVTFNGNISMPNGGSISGFKFTGGSITIGGSTPATTTTIQNCYFNPISPQVSIVYSNSDSASQLNIINCQGFMQGNAPTFMTFSSAGNCLIQDTKILVNSVNPVGITHTGFQLVIINSDLNFPITTSGTARLFIKDTRIDASSGFSGAVALTHNSTAGVTNSCLLDNVMLLSSGGLSAVTIGAGATLVMTGNCTVSSSNTNAISGTGTLRYTPISFLASSLINSTLTATQLSYGPNATFSGSGTGATITANSTSHPVELLTATTAGTNTTDQVSRYNLKSTGTPASGFGAVLQMYADNASNTLVDQCFFGGVWDTATAGSESAHFQVAVRNGGAENNAFRAYFDHVEVPAGNSYRVIGAAGFYSGSGDPNTVVTAPKGSYFARTDGSGVNNRGYINTDSGTTWTAVVTVA